MATKYYPKAELKLSGAYGGSMRGGPARGVIHTTETTDFGGKTHYHVAVKEEADGTIKWEQYIPFDGNAGGLLHNAGTVDTNKMGDYCIQVAIIGYAKDAPTYSWNLLNALGDFMVWCNQEFGIKIDAPLFYGSSAYGHDKPQRFTDQQWKDWDGWCGHQHVPNNEHWDPGKIDIYFLIARMRGWNGDRPAPVPWQDVLTYLRGLNVSRASALGILANIQSESRFKPGAVGDSGSSGGLCQWHSGRWDALRKYANSYTGKYWTDWRTQIQFALKEARGLGIDLQATDAKAATRDWMLKFERPADQTEANIQRRIANLSLFDDSSPTPTPEPPTQPPTGECGAIADELTNHGFKDFCALLDVVVKIEHKLGI